MAVTVEMIRFKKDSVGNAFDDLPLNDWLEYLRKSEALYEVKPGDEMYDFYSGDSWVSTDPQLGTAEIRGTEPEEKWPVYYRDGRLSIPAPLSEDEWIWVYLRTIVEDFSAIICDEEGQVLISADERYPEETYLP